MGTPLQPNLHATLLLTSSFATQSTGSKFYKECLGNSPLNPNRRLEVPQPARLPSKGAQSGPMQPALKAPAGPSGAILQPLAPRSAVLNAAVSPPSKAPRSSLAAGFSHAREREQRERERERERALQRPAARPHKVPAADARSGPSGARVREVWAHPAPSGGANMPAEPDQPPPLESELEHQRKEWASKVSKRVHA